MLDLRCCCCSEPAVLAEDEGAVLRERPVQDLAPTLGSWQAGTHAQTGLAACLAGFSLTAEQATSSPAPVASETLQQLGTSAEASEAPANAAAVPSPQEVKEAEALGSAAEVRMERQPFLDSTQKGNQPESNGNSSHQVDSRRDCIVPGQGPPCAGKEQELEEAEGKGDIAADHPGDQPAYIAPPSMQAGAAGTVDQGVPSEHQRAAEQLGLEQREAQAHGSGSAQQPHQECEICFQPMRFAYVSAPAMKAIIS